MDRAIAGLFRKRRAPLGDKNNMLTQVALSIVWRALSFIKIANNENKQAHGTQNLRRSGNSRNQQRARLGKDLVQLPRTKRAA
jgi:hypothetical protein